MKTTVNYSDAAFIRHPRTQDSHGIALLPHWQQRQQLENDTISWIASGHCIEQLPPGTVPDIRFDGFTHLMIEAGFPHEL